MNHVPTSSPQHRSESPDLAASIDAWLRREADEPGATATSIEAEAAEAALRRVFQQLPEPSLPVSFTDAVMTRVAATGDRVWSRRLERWGGVTLLVAAALCLLVLPPVLATVVGDAGLGLHTVSDTARWMVAAAADWASAALAFWAWCAGLVGTLLRAFASKPGLLMLATCALLGLATWSALGPRFASSLSNLPERSFLRGA